MSAHAVVAVGLALMACRPATEASREPEPPRAARTLATLATLAPPEWSPGAPMSQARSGHTVTLLSDGKLLVVGGRATSGALASAELFDPATGTWSTTSSPSQAREHHTATLLPNGKVLIVGGKATSGALASAELFDPATGTWSTTSSPSQAREHHTATLLHTGEVLIVGGAGATGSLSLAEFYDPVTETWTATGALATARSRHTATLLPGGTVLVTGGDGATGVLDSSEVYDPATGTWNPTGPLRIGRGRHAATLLRTGKVLVSGGKASSSLADCELYDPVTGVWDPAGSLVTARNSHLTLLLPNGKVLAVGGDGSTGELLNAELYAPGGQGSWSATAGLNSARALPSGTLLPTGKVLVAGGGNASGSLASVEVYDPSPTGSWTSAGSLLQARYRPTVTLLANGKVLVAGGAGEEGTLNTAELYDPGTGTWTATGSLAVARYAHTATLLPNGLVLVVGGESAGAASAELYDPSTGTWSVTAPLPHAHAHHTATLLTDGRVLIAGSLYFFDSAFADLYDPATNTWTTTGSLREGRHGHSATLLRDGKVLIVGGEVGGEDLKSAELYDPQMGKWSPTGSLPNVREVQTATLLPDGRVILIGGYSLELLNRTLTEVYDPVTGTWTSMGTTAHSRLEHTATLLPNGKILVSGGVRVLDNNNRETEVYDPMTNTWSSTGNLSGVHRSGGAVLLADGRVLLVGGADAEGLVSSAELYEDTGASAAWRPAVNSISPSTALEPGTPLTVSGSGFRGLSEASSGLSLSSPTDFPLLTLVDFVRGHRFTLPLSDFSDSQASAILPAVPPGHYVLSVSVNALSGGKVIRVDQTDLETSITSKPDSITHKTTATFAFRSSQAGSSFECSLDGNGFATCFPPVAFASLAEGVHTFRVRARNTSNRVDPTPAIYTWTIDLTAPETIITAGPLTPSNQSVATFAFTSSEPTSGSFECSLDGAGFSPCLAPKPLALLATGEHLFQVRARDEAGNVDATPASYSWTIDLAAPGVSITSAPAVVTNETTATFYFTAPPGNSLECALDGASFSPCTSPKPYFGFPGEGSHTFSLQARNAAGQVTAQASHTWTIDLTAPETTFLSSPQSLSNQTTATFNFNASEAGSRFECSLNESRFSPCTPPMGYTKLPEGLNTLRVQARDAAGNLGSTPASYSWTVDLTAPETGIDIKPDSSTNQTATFFLFGSGNAEDKFECSLDGAAYEVCSSPKLYSDRLAPLSEGAHTFNVRAIDKAGNMDSSPASHVWTIDLTDPETRLTQSPGRFTRETTATFTVTSSESGISFECRLDRVEHSSCRNMTGLGGEHTFEVTVSEGEHTLEIWAKDPTGNRDPSPAAHTWTVDGTAPPTPQLQELAHGQTFLTQHPRFSGTAEPYSLVTLVIDGGDAGTAEANELGLWSATPVAPVSWGKEHRLRVRATDQAGNSSKDSSEVLFFTTRDGYYGMGCSASPATWQACWPWALLLLGLLRRRRSWS